MILAEKITKLRKQKGWSQEELALRLNVSRQSVSKWESMTSLPDLDKIIKLSELFGVSTDYLLRDEMEEEPGFEAADSYDKDEEYTKKRPFSLEETNTYISLVEKASKRIAAGVAACIFSAVPLIILGASASGTKMTGAFVGIHERTYGVIGLAILLVIIACAVVTFIVNGMALDKYEFLEREPLDLEYGVEGIIKTKKEAFEPVFKRSIAIGVALCILSVVPLCIAVAMNVPAITQAVMVGVLLLVVAVGVYQFVWAGMIFDGYQRILEEGDYTYRKKVENKQNSNLSKVYWAIVTALYLAISFITGSWHITWVVWPVAGIAYAAVCGIANMVRKK